MAQTTFVLDSKELKYKLFAYHAANEVSWTPKLVRAFL